MDFHTFGRADHSEVSLGWFFQRWCFQTWYGSCLTQLLRRLKSCNCFHRGSFVHILSSTWIRQPELRYDQAHGHILPRSCTDYHSLGWLGLTMSKIRIATKTYFYIRFYHHLLMCLILYKWPDASYNLYAWLNSIDCLFASVTEQVRCRSCCHTFHFLTQWKRYLGYL